MKQVEGWLEKADPVGGGGRSPGPRNGESGEGRIAITSSHSGRKTERKKMSTYSTFGEKPILWALTEGGGRVLSSRSFRN